MIRPAQGDLDLLDDPAAKRLLESSEVAHLAYTWSDGTPRCTPIWFHWTGTELVMSSPSISPKTKTIDDRTPVAVTIDSADWPYAALMLRGRAQVDDVEGIAPEYREAAHRYFGDEEGDAWCGQLPERIRMTLFRMRPEWVGVLDFDGLRRVTSALATLMPD
jgi:nitroimidazol reductase NimA-like FMN-containing flavoprotein (pyridoxamine 5'-phosphate oxidase superfamily)